jgi:hypothetical protein
MDTRYNGMVVADRLIPTTLPPSLITGQTFLPKKSNLGTKSTSMGWQLSG